MEMIVDVLLIHLDANMLLRPWPAQMAMKRCNPLDADADMCTISIMAPRLTNTVLGQHVLGTLV
jgi:hypothetical protein